MTGASWILAATDHGPMIVNRLDFNTSLDAKTGKYLTFGVGFNLLQHGIFDREDMEFGIKAMKLRKKYRGDGVVAVDVGANIGAFTVPWAKACAGWGEVFAFEAQERVFYALAGNVALNNLRNARVFHHVVTDTDEGYSVVPMLDFDVPGSYGSVSLIDVNHDIGQDIDDCKQCSIENMSVDVMFAHSRVDFVKIDVEGMEFDVLRGAEEVLRRERPVLMVEWLKVEDRDGMKKWIEDRGYVVLQIDSRNVRAVHRDDPCLDHLG